MPEEHKPTSPGEEHRIIIQTEQIPSQAWAQLNDLNLIISQIVDRVGHIEAQLAQQHILIEQLSQKYTAIMKAFQKIAPNLGEESQTLKEQT